MKTWQPASRIEINMERVYVFIVVFCLYACSAYFNNLILFQFLFSHTFFETYCIILVELCDAVFVYWNICTMYNVHMLSIFHAYLCVDKQSVCECWNLIFIALWMIHCMCLLFAVAQVVRYLWDLYTYKNFPNFLLCTFGKWKGTVNSTRKYH